MNLANSITLARFPLLIGIVWMLYRDDGWVRGVAALLIVVLIFMDAVDGIIARSRHEETLLGSVLDIAADRAVEIVLWVVFAHLGLIPMLIPITVILRGALTDSVREAGYQRGESAHAQMTTGWGRWIVAGRPMRAGYGLVKAAAFTFLAVTLALQSAAHPWAAPVEWFAVACSWVALVLCIVRGIPVVVEALAWPEQAKSGGAAKATPARHKTKQSAS